MREYDVRRALSSLYAPGKDPALVQVPQQLYCIVDGEGKAEDESYELAVQLLIAMSNTLHAQFGRHRLYQNFTVSPLECLWSPLEIENRQTWQWSAMIAQPEWLSEELFLQVRDQVAFKQGLYTSSVHLGLLEEGLCITAMHTGSYEDEGATIKRMQAFCDEHDLKRVGTSHREIYLDNHRHTQADLLRTVIRFSVKAV
ncbi:MAG: hypothetical protein EOM48_10440 [Bacilli bacterium]|nr:hypothetical protein [Bacilli bacterium]